MSIAQLELVTLGSTAAFALLGASAFLSWPLVAALSATKAPAAANPVARASKTHERVV